jgi:hypothetical protein
MSLLGEVNFYFCCITQGYLQPVLAREYINFMQKGSAEAIIKCSSASKNPRGSTAAFTRSDYPVSQSVSTRRTSLSRASEMPTEGRAPLTGMVDINKRRGERSLAWCCLDIPLYFSTLLMIFNLAFGQN